MGRQDDPHQLDECDTDAGPLAWERRVWLVALVWCGLGTLLGGMIGLMLGAVTGTPAIGKSGLILGGLVGALAGGMLEAEHWGI